MNKSFLLGCLLAVVAMFSAGCGSGTDEPAPCTLRAKVNGADWCGNATVRTVASTTTIAATGNGREVMTITLLKTEPGTYQLVGNATFINGLLNTHVATSGTLNITKLENNRISGTFSFQALSQTVGLINITEGSFTDLQVQ